MTLKRELHQGEQRAQESGHWMELIPSPKWVRVFFGGAVIADSRRTQMLRESGHTPVYYFPEEDVRMDLLAQTEHSVQDPDKGDARYFTVKSGDRVAENAAWSYPEPPSEASYLKGYLAFEWSRMDAWFEEDEEVFVHPRDPYKRVDIVQSSRHVSVVVAGETVADTHHPVLLFETGMPTRYYIPKVDLRMDLLRPSEKGTSCPYKGDARYYSVAVGDITVPDIAWYYSFPTSEASRLASLVSFFNERVEALYVDGELMPKPKTKWS